MLPLIAQPKSATVLLLRMSGTTTVCYLHSSDVGCTNWLNALEIKSANFSWLHASMQVIWMHQDDHIRNSNSTLISQKLLGAALFIASLQRRGENKSDDLCHVWYCLCVDQTWVVATLDGCTSHARAIDAIRTPRAHANKATRTICG